MLWNLQIISLYCKRPQIISDGQIIPVGDLKHYITKAVHFSLSSIL